MIKISKTRTKFTNFLIKSEAKNFVGYRQTKEAFRNAIRALKGAKLKSQNGCFVIGVPGYGKSSLLTIFEEIAKAERVKIVEASKLVHLGKKNSYFLRELKQLLVPFLVDKKGGFMGIGVKKRRDIPIAPINPGGEYAQSLESFIQNFHENEFLSPEIPIFIFLDNVERFTNYSEKLIPMLGALIRECSKKNLPFYFCVSLSRSIYEKYEEDEFKGIPVHLVDRLEIAEAEVLLRKLSDTCRRNSKMTKDFVKKSGRIPMNIVFVADVLAWAEMQIDKPAAEALDEILELAKPIIETWNFREFIKDVFQLTPDEIQLFSYLLEQQTNYCPMEKLREAKNIKINAIGSLVRKGLVIKEDDNLVCSSLALHDKAGQKIAVDAVVESELLVTLIERDWENGLKPQKTIVDRLAKISGRQIKGREEGAKILGDRIQRIFEKCFTQDLFYLAFNLANIAGSFYSGDEEGAAVFLEDAGKQFADRGKLHYAKEMYKKAMNFYTADYRRKNAARETASIYMDLVREAQKNKHKELIRALLYQAIQLYTIADERTKADEAIKRVLETYPEGDTGREFFEKLSIKDQIEEEV